MSMCERLGSDDLIYVATAVDVQSQVGGSLAGVFETVADTVRERQQHRRRLRALTATGRATATAMAAMPFVFLGLLLIVAPGYVTPFLSSHIGHVLMVLSVFSIAIGAFILSRIVVGEGVAMVILLALRLVALRHAMRARRPGGASGPDAAAILAPPRRQLCTRPRIRRRRRSAEKRPTLLETAVPALSRVALKLNPRAQTNELQLRLAAAA